MATISNNTKGNKLHDEETGEFTSKDDASSKKEQIKVSLKQGANLDNLKNSMPKISIKQGIDLSQLKNKLDERMSISKVPMLSSADDVVNNIDKFVNKDFALELDAHYGKHSQAAPYNYQPFTFSDGKKGLAVNMYVQMLSKYRYNAVYCRTIEPEEFNNIANLINKEGSGKFQQYYDRNGRRQYGDRDFARVRRDTNIGCGYVMGFRGINFGGDYNWKSHLNEALNSYIGEHTSGPTFGGQGCYGTVNYVAISNDYAKSYDGYQGHVMKHIIDLREAKVLYEDQAYEIRSKILEKADEIQPKLVEKFSQYVGPQRAQQLATGFMGSLRHDLGLTCVLTGYDVLLAGIGNGNQMDVLNWNVARILKDW